MGVRAIRSKSSDARGVEQEPPLFLTGGFGRCCAHTRELPSSPGGGSRGGDRAAHTGLCCCLGTAHTSGAVGRRWSRISSQGLGSRWPEVSEV